jgi:hypothetical protein
MRLEQILEELQDPTLRPKLAKNPTTMGSSYISGKAVEITEAKERVNALGEELELALSKADINLSDLKEQLELRTEVQLLSLTPHDVEGMDATTRKALAKKRAEESWLTEMLQIAQQEGKTPPNTTLRAEIQAAEAWFKKLKTVSKIVDNRRQDLTRLDSTLRLQLTSVQVESSLFGKVLTGVPKTDSRTNFIRTSPDDSISRDVDNGLVGNETFNTLITDLPNPNSE